MVLELYLTGLLIFVRDPCPAKPDNPNSDTKTMTAVFPKDGGHHTQLIVDVEDLEVKDADSTYDASNMVQPPRGKSQADFGKQYAVWEIDSDLVFTVDGKDTPVKIDDDTFSLHLKSDDPKKPPMDKGLVPDLGIVTFDAKYRKVKTNSISTNPHLAFKIDQGVAPTLSAFSTCSYYWKWENKKTAKSHDQMIASHALVENHSVMRTVEFSFKSGGKSQTIVLTSKKGDPIRAMIVNLPKKVKPKASEKTLSHFPMYYDHLDSGKPGDLEVPIRDGGSCAIKPVACVTCQGCGP